LKNPALNRLAQRTRLRFKVEPLNAGELLAYLKHGFRLAGAEYEHIFTDDVAPLLHDLCGGVPRLVNKLVDTVLTPAAGQRRSRVDARLLAQVAKEQFGLACSLPAAPPEARSVGAEPPKAIVRKAQADAPVPARPAQVPAADKSERRFVADTLPNLEQLAPELANPSASAEDSAEIPTLFSSARMEAPTPAAATSPPKAPATAAPPVVAVPTRSAPPVAGAVAPSVTIPPAVARPASISPVPIPAIPAPAAPLPGTAQRAAPAHPPPTHGSDDEVPAPADDIPAWDKDPTLAELRPDIEALELAMAEFSRDEPVRPSTTDDDDPVIELKNATFAGVPEITLDIAIQQKIAEATDALKKQEQTLAEETIADAPAPTKAAPEKSGKKTATPVSNAEATRSADMKKVAEGIASAKSLEDVDDKMAETLFGEEFSAIAAAVAANAPSLHETGSEDAADGDDASVKASMEREFREVYGVDAVEVSLQGDLPRGGLDLSASQRLATVRALNAERPLSESARIRAAAAKAGVAAANRVVPSQSIEEQITTSLTQTLRTLNVRPANDDGDDDDDDDDRKGGFFSRFRRH
jgi:hypothetical protein